MKRALFVAVGLIFGVTANAHGESPVEKLRHNYMEAVGGHMGSMGTIMKHGLKHPEHIKAHAKALAEIAPLILDVFPKGSAGGDAKEEIWKTWDDFVAKADAFKKAAAAMGTAGASGDMKKIGMAMGDLGKACKACHEKYKDD